MSRTTQISSFEVLQNEYSLYLQALGFSQSIVYNYPKMLFYFFEYLKSKGIEQIDLLTQTHLSEYIEHLQSRENMRAKNQALSTAHLNKNFDCLDKFCEFLAQNGSQIDILPPNYRIFQSKTDYLAKIKVLSKSEIQALYQATERLFSHFTYKETEPRQALATTILDLCYGCGLRRSEAYQVKLTDIDFDKKLLFVQQGKGYKDRYIPLSNKIAERLQLFSYQHRKSFYKRPSYLIPLSKGGIYCYFKIILKESNLNKKVGLHTLRHSIATHLLQNGMSIEQISRFLGHSSLESTQVYTHLINEPI